MAYATADKNYTRCPSRVTTIPARRIARNGCVEGRMMDKKWLYTAERVIFFLELIGWHETVNVRLPVQPPCARTPARPRIDKLPVRTNTSRSPPASLC